jgi:general transcription factor 3C polypeptide 3 (transcription factor C subunit 4)
MVLLQLGRCHFANGDHATAEEYFLAAIETDEDNIDARIELANMYEKTREEEEALILAAEAMALREARDQDHDPNQNPEGVSIPYSSTQTESRVPRRRATGARAANRTTGKRVIPRRYRPKRLAGPDKRAQDEQSRAVKLSQQYEVVRDLRRQIKAGRSDLIKDWMASSKELVDDFRSLKKFYTWEKYLRFLGTRSSLEHPEAGEQKTELSKMYERLARSKSHSTATLGLRRLTFLLSCCTQYRIRRPGESPIGVG